MPRDHPLERVERELKVLRVVAGTMARAGAEDPQTAWSGVGVALGPSVFGFSLLGVAAVAWLGLQYVAGRRS